MKRAFEALAAACPKAASEILSIQQPAYLRRQKGRQVQHRYLPRLSPAPISGLLSHGLAKAPDQTALITSEGNWSWQQLEHASGCYANRLMALGLKTGDRIASLLPNCAAHVIHYLACFKAGFVATPLNYRYTSSEIDHALRVSGARAILVHSDRRLEIGTSSTLSLPLGVVCYGGAAKGDHSFEAMLDGPGIPQGLPAPKPSDPAAIFFTSGSTGPAKGVTHSFHSLDAAIGSFVEGCQTTSDDVVLAAGSISHIGSFMDMSMALSVGGSVVIPRGLDGQELLSLLREHRPTVFISLPVVLYGLVGAATATLEDFSSLRLCSAGGDKVPMALIEAVASLTGLSVNEQYGMCEIGMATINPPDGVNKRGSIGRRMSGYDLSIRDKHGDEVPLGTPGRLWVKSPSNMIGYWDDPEATQTILKDGWLDTGDVVSMDGDGYLWFLGRQKQLILHDGSNISPQEVEDALMAHPAVFIAGVIGVPDVIHGENVHAFVTLVAGAEIPTTDELIAFARVRVGYKAPESIVVLDRMLIGATDKVDRKALRAMQSERFPTLQRIRKMEPER